MHDQAKFEEYKEEQQIPTDTFLLIPKEVISKSLVTTEMEIQNPLVNFHSVSHTS